MNAMCTIAFEQITKEIEGIRARNIYAEASILIGSKDRHGIQISVKEV